MATGEPAVEGETHFRCVACGHVRESRNQPPYIRRPCGKPSANQQTPGNDVSRFSRWQKAVAKWKAAGKPVRSDAVVLTILETKCQPCEHFNPRGKCRLCACKLNIGKNARFNKIRMATERCPVNKWLSWFDEAVLQCLAAGRTFGGDIMFSVCKSLDLDMTSSEFYNEMFSMEEAGIVAGYWKMERVFAASPETLPMRFYRPLDYQTLV